MTDSPNNRLSDEFESRVAVVFALLGYALLLTLWRTFTLISRQDDNYQQSDWLINYSGGIVRRGISGEIVFWFSDRIDANPLLIVGVLVSLLTAAIFGVVLLRVIQLGMNDRLLIALFSPAFLLFWANDFGGSHRKELMAFVAFLPLVISNLSGGQSYALRILIVFLFGIAVAFSEVNVFLAPMLIAAIFVRFPGKAIVNTINGAFIFGLASAGAAFAFRFSSIENPGLVCERVISYGLSMDLCGGAFDWLASQIDDAFASSALTFNGVSLSGALLLVSICVGPVIALLSCLRFSKVEIALLVVGALSVLPLFMIAVDWGRWIAFVTFGLTFIGLIRGGHPDAYRRSAEVPSGQRSAEIAVLLGVGIGHVSIVPIGGYVFTVLQSIIRVAP